MGNRLLVVVLLMSLCFSLSGKDSVMISPIDTVKTDTVHMEELQKDTLITDVMPYVRVYQSKKIQQLFVEKSTGVGLQQVQGSGYRVQIYSSNHQQLAKQEAIRLEKYMQSRLNVPVYVTYVPPFWKVRVGDFATYEEALEFKNSFVQEFPLLMGDTYVVRDQVTLKR